MGMKTYNPTTPSQRFRQSLDNKELAKKRPEWKRAGDIATALLTEINLWLVYTGKQKKDYFNIWFYNGIPPPSLPARGEVWIRPEASVAGTRFTWCVPPS